MKNTYYLDFVPVSPDRETICIPFKATSYQVDKLAYVLSFIFKHSRYSSVVIEMVSGDAFERVVTLDFPLAKEDF